MQTDGALQLATTQLNRVRSEIGKIIVGQREVVDGVLICLLAGGHVLLEGVPGLGKTTLLRTLSRVLHLKYSRIQFTPDLMPGDIVGSAMMDTTEGGSKSLRFQPGPIFSNLVLADEINRATPKTQSALLEAMQEHTVTSGTQTHILEAPFLVMATQNPIEMEGTYPLPEAQLDRFLMKILVQYPSRSDLGVIVDRTIQQDEISVQPVLDHGEIMGLRDVCRQVLVAPHVQDHAIDLVMATQPTSSQAHALTKKFIRYGSSPRGAQALVECGRVHALFHGHMHLATEDILAVAPAVLRHRVILNFDAHAEGENTESILKRLIAETAAVAPVAEPLLTTAFLERLERLTIYWQRSLPGLIGGHTTSRFGGPGQEFLDHRQFYQGDDLRAVNWRAYLRLDKLVLKMFQLEPRVPMRILVDVSASMTTGGTTGAAQINDKFVYARQLAAALCYVGLVRLDAMTIQPFSNKLHDAFNVSGGRHRIQPALNFLTPLKPAGQTNFMECSRQFIANYPQRGMVIVISDFLDDGEFEKPLQFLSDYGHELLLIQVWADEDRTPPWDGELELEDAETGERVELAFDRESRAQYTAAFDEYAQRVRLVAQRNNGRYLGIPTSIPVDQAIFGPLVNTGAVA